MKRVLLTVMLFTVGSVGLAAETIKATTPPQKILTSDGARFVFGQVSDFRADQFMLDTKTGRAWRLVYEDGAPVLQPVLYIDHTNPIAPRTAEPKEKQPTPAAGK